MPTPTQTALLLPSPSSPLLLSTRPIPTPTPTQLLIHIQTAALNPVDRYMQDTGFLVPGYPMVCGVDGAGVVVSVGEEVRGFEVGERV